MRFVVLRMLSNSVSLVGRVLINPCSTLLIAGEEPIAQVYLRARTKIKYHIMHGKDMLGRLTLMLQHERLEIPWDQFADELCMPANMLDP